MMNQYFAVHFTAGPNWLPDKTIFPPPIDGHVAYIKALYDMGKVVMAGPFADGQGGMTILQVEDDEEARAIVSADPDVRAGLLHPEIRRYAPIAWRDVSASSLPYENVPLILHPKA